MRRVGVLRPTIGTVAGVLGFVAVAAGCSGALAPGNAETDRIAKVVSDAISYPRQDSAAGYARAALATRAGQDGRLRVVAIEELKADELGDPLGRLVFLIHLEGSEAGWTRSPPVTACYKAEFSFYGVVGGPRRMICPRDASPITPPPTQPTPEIAIPDGADAVVGCARRHPNSAVTSGSRRRGRRLRPTGGEQAGQLMMWQTRSGGHRAGSRVPARSASWRSSPRSCWSSRMR